MIVVLIRNEVLVNEWIGEARNGGEGKVMARLY